MIYTDLTRKAMRIAFEAHKEQTDKGGLPYIFHPFHLAEQMDTEDEVIVALLHDVVEDTDVMVDELRSYGFSEYVMNALSLLTYDEKVMVEYMDYISAIKTNPLAVKVKLADLRHNSDITRLDSVDSKATERIAKYKRAIDFLQVAEKTSCVDIERKTIRVSLDSRRLFFLSVFYDKMGIARKYSIDVEKAEDSHYEIDAVEMKKLIDYFNGKLENPLKKYLKRHSEHDLLELLDKLHIQYTPFHYDCYD